MFQRRRTPRDRSPRRPLRLELLETRETISDTVFGPAVLASALALGDRLAPVASPLPPPLHYAS